ncbi:MAG TPA: DUF1580 domain-containing protein [Phycisphaerae bacterium]|nr:DUF1580 domain-containing protein [Phycisphaerae bacterium]
MPIDITNETLLSLTEATKVLPPVNGKRPAIATLWRWCRKGLGGVQLEYVRVGRNIATSREALNRFVNALAAADVPPEQPQLERVRETLAPAPRARQRMLDDADRILERARI